MRTKLLVAAVALVAFGGGTALGINLQGGGRSPTAPASASAGGSAPATTSAKASPAASKTPSKKQVTVYCTTLGGNLSGTPSLGGCTKLTATGGSGTLTSGSLARAGSMTLTWNGTGTTTFVFWSTRPTLNQSRCPGNDIELILHGTVTANSPVGVGNGGVKGKVGAKVCVDASSNLTLLPGHTFNL